MTFPRSEDTVQLPINLVHLQGRGTMGYQVIRIAFLHKIGIQIQCWVVFNRYYSRKIPCDFIHLRDRLRSLVTLTDQRVNNSSAFFIPKI